NTDDLFVGKTLLHGDVLMWLMKTLLTSGCTNQRGAGQSLLPQGQQPWSTIGSKILSAIKIRGKGNTAVVEGRLELINSKKPDFVAVGQAGFQGYVIFGFTGQNIYVLESSQCNNATYILNNNWQQLSQLTKAEILDGNLHHARVIHRVNWAAEILKYLP
ncbi:hypothetical protein ACM2VE_24090, partial [Escherichia coli]